MFRKHHVTIALSTLSITACQSSPALHELRQPLFALGLSGDSRVAIGPTGAAVPMAGKLTVNFARSLDGLVRQRRVLATIADVDKVVVSVKPAGGTSIEQTVLKAAIANGQTTVTFQGLAPGEAIVTITAFDAADVHIGTVQKTANIQVGQTAMVDVALQLSPTLANGPGGGNAPTTGSLATSVLIQDGPVVKTVPGGQIKTFVMPFTVFEVAANGRDAVWVTGLKDEKPVLARLSTAGVIERLVTDIGYAVEEVDVDAEGDAWVPGTDAAGVRTLSEYGADGALKSRRTLPADSGFVTTMHHVRVDDVGNLYSFGGSMMNGGGRQWAPDGTVTPYAGPGKTATPGTLDDLWIGVLYQMDFNGNMNTPSDVMRLSKTGGVLGRYDIGAGYQAAYTAIDAQGNAWVTAYSQTFPVTANGRVVKFTAQGQHLGTYELSQAKTSNAIEIGADGRVWVLANEGTVTCLDSSGQELGIVDVGTFNPWRFGVTDNGAWVRDQDGAVVHVDIEN